LRRQFLFPSLVVVATQVGFMFLYRPRNDDPGVGTWLAGIGMLAADVAALIGVSMATALTAKNPNLSSILTIWRVLVIPWLVLTPIAVAASITANVAGIAQPQWGFYLGLWIAVGLAADLGFGLAAWWRLSNRFRQLAQKRFLAR
jgi:hypothetical protein